MAKPAIKALGALLVLVLVAGALPAQASCNCAMPPTAPNCCDAPSNRCASAELAVDGCQAVVHDDSAILLQIHEISGDSPADALTRTGSGPLPEAALEGRACAVDTSPQIPYIALFELDCCFLI